MADRYVDPLAEALKNLKSGFDMFKEGVQAIGTSEAVNEATTQVQEVIASAESDRKKQSLIFNIGRSLASQFMAMGKDPREAQTALMAYQAQDPIAQQDYDAERRMQELKVREAGEDRRLRMQLSAQERIADLRAGAKEGKVIAPETLTKFADFQSAHNSLVDIAQKLEKDPGVQGWWSTAPGVGAVTRAGRRAFDQEYIEFQTKLQNDFNQYRVAITGAGASEKELAALERVRPNESDTPPALRAKIKTWINLGKQIGETRVKSFASGGYQVPEMNFKDYDTAIQENYQQSPTSLPGLYTDSDTSNLDLTNVKLYLKPRK